MVNWASAGVHCPELRGHLLIKGCGSGCPLLGGFVKGGSQYKVENFAAFIYGPCPFSLAFFAASCLDMSAQRQLHENINRPYTYYTVAAQKG